MAEQVKIKLRDLGPKVNVEVKDIKFPDGKVFTHQYWEKDSMVAAVKVAQQWQLKGKDAMLQGGVPTWLVAAVVQVINADRAFFYCDYLGKDVELVPLPVGEVNPEGGIEFNVYEEDDKVYVHYIADPPEVKKHVHTLEQLAKVVVPRIPENKHVFLWGIAATHIQVCLVKSYAPLSKSVSLSNYTDQFLYGAPRFTCTITKTAERELGDVEPMYYPEDSE